CRIVAPPLLALGWCCRHLQRRGTPPAPRFIYSGKKLLSIRNRNLFQGRACKAGFPPTRRCPPLRDAAAIARLASRRVIGSGSWRALSSLSRDQLPDHHGSPLKRETSDPGSPPPRSNRAGQRRRRRPSLRLSRLRT